MGVFKAISYPTALTRLFGEAPFYPRCSYNKTAVYSRPRHLAFDYPYMQVNRKDQRSWLVFDLDESADWLWESEPFPAPNLIVRDPETGKAHWYYAIESVLTGPKARQAPVKFMRSIYKAMRARIGADLDYWGGPVAKTPNHPQWETTELHAKVYSLGELADYPFVDDYQKNERSLWRQDKGVGAESHLENAHSRHVHLFLALQKIAFSSVWTYRCRGASGFTLFFDHLLDHAHRLNRYQQMGFSRGNLPTSSLKATAKSVSRWVWENYFASSRPNLGIMGLDKTLPLKERQKLSASRTRDIKTANTQAKIKSGVKALSLRGESINFSSIAAETGLCRQTVSRHRSVVTSTLACIDEMPKSSNHPPASPKDSSSADHVSFGAHQVTTVGLRYQGVALSGLADRVISFSEQDENGSILPLCRGGP